MKALHLKYGTSIRQTCKALLISRGSFYYQSKRVEQVYLKKRIREIAMTRVHYGYLRIHTLLRREGWKVNHKRVHRLYKEENLQMRRKKPKRRVQVKRREDRVVAQAKNDCWSMDFVSDQLFSGKKIRILTMVDNHTRESPGMGVGYCYKGQDVVKTLNEAVMLHGCPRFIRVDNGPEFISKELDRWAYENKVVLDFSRPGKPTDNAFIESFNSRFRQECLNQHWFVNLEEARERIEGWWRDYNSHRPHSSLNYQTPLEFSKKSLHQAV